MKIATGAADGFVKNPDPRIRAVLLYGPDSGLVRERGGILARTVVDDLGDPFRAVELQASVLRDDPARLADEAAAMALTGGRRVVRLVDTGDGAVEAFGTILGDARGDTLVIAEAGDLGPRSRLRRLFESAPDAAAIACYADDARTLLSVIRQTMADNGLEIAEDAVAYLAENLGGDRMVTRSELEKLALYVAGAGHVTLDDALACVGDSAGVALDDIAFATASGDQPALARALRRAFDEGANPVAVLRVASRHFQRLHLTASRIAAGESADAAVKALRPPVFFKRAEAFRGQARRWPAAALAAALESLTEAELACKSTGMPAEAACDRALMRLAQRAGARRA